MGEFSGSFPDYTIFTCKFKTDDALYSWDVFSLQVGNILKLYGSKTHYDYDYCYNLNFFSVIFHQQLNITFRKSSAPPPPPQKIHSPLPRNPTRPLQKGRMGRHCAKTGFQLHEKRKTFIFYWFQLFPFSLAKKRRKGPLTEIWVIKVPLLLTHTPPPYYWLPIHFQNFVNLPHPPNFTVSQPFSNCIQIHYVKPCYDHLMKATEEWWFWV